MATSRKAGVPAGSVPMIDVGGELLHGFDRARLDKLLGVRERSLG